jgi:uncharacterized membrane protein
MQRQTGMSSENSRELYTMDQHIVTESIIVKGDVSTIYAIWSDFGNLPRL